MSFSQMYNENPKQTLHQELSPHPAKIIQPDLRGTYHLQTFVYLTEKCYISNPTF